MTKCTCFILHVTSAVLLISGCLQSIWSYSALVLIIAVFNVLNVRSIDISVPWYTQYLSQIYPGPIKSLFNINANNNRLSGSIYSLQLLAGFRWRAAWVRSQESHNKLVTTTVGQNVAGSRVEIGFV